MSRWRQILVTAVVTVAVAVALPALALAQSSEAKAGRIKSALERDGLKVLDVTFLPRNGGPPYWFATTSAIYARPNWPDVARQALVTWLATNEVVRDEPADTLLFSAQVWTKYAIQLGQTNDKVTRFANELKAAKTSADRDRAVKAILAHFFVRMYDIERDRFVDVKDFVSKNFID